MATNGHALHETHEHQAKMNRVFPEARSKLADADPELFAIMQDEKRRQW